LKGIKTFIINADVFESGVGEYKRNLDIALIYVLQLS